jgi:hypothetical protein
MGPNWAMEGVLCEDFDTNRNGNGTYDWTRLFLAADPTDNLRGIPDPSDDVLGHSVNGGPTPLGVNGTICLDDFGYTAARSTCYPVPTENDWHLHSQYEGCGAGYDPIGMFTTSCAPEPRAHSGYRSLHMGRHLNATDTLGDTYRLRQTSAFVMDPVNLGTASLLEFWHIIQVCDDKCTNPGAGATTAGGQVHISLMDNSTGKYERWQRLTPTQNGYNSIDNDAIVICEFDPQDDYLPPNNQTMCGGVSPQWSDIGDFYGSDRTCLVDQDGNDPTDKDCGSTTNRTVRTTCSWLTDPNCGSFLETGSQGRGVWGRSQFNLGSFSGRVARLRWIFQGGGGWGFGESRSFLEPEPGNPPSTVYDNDDGWHVDDILMTDLRTAPASITPDPDDGLYTCPSQGDTANCGVIGIVISGAAQDAVTGDWTLWAQSGNVGSPISLDARQSASGDDPGTTGIVELGCATGVLEFQWSQLDSLGNVVDVIAPWSPKPNIMVTTASGIATYQVDARCTSDLTCTASRKLNILSYTGEGQDLGTVYGTQVTNGLKIDHDSGTNVATLSWKSVPQLAGVSGYDLFRGTISGIGSDIFASARFFGGAWTCNVAQGGVGSWVSQTDATVPAVGSAYLYMLGHSSSNTLAIAPLGYRPSTSNRAGTLVSASVACP